MINLIQRITKNNLLKNGLILYQPIFYISKLSQKYNQSYPYNPK
jgi:hypothetical protein